MGTRLASSYEDETVLGQELTSRMVDLLYIELWQPHTRALGARDIFPNLAWDMVGENSEVENLHGLGCAAADSREASIPWPISFGLNVCPFEVN